jgi:hypothetical protein
MSTEIASSMTPVSTDAVAHHFQHDCKNCKPLGHYNEHDLYFCTQGGLVPTVLARYGSEGPEYLSGLTLASAVPELGEAARRAVAAGYLHKSALPKGVRS